MAGHWEHFPHEADIGIRGFGATPAEAFEQAALAMSAAATASGWPTICRQSAAFSRSLALTASTVKWSW